MHDYYLGGRDNFGSDRQMAQRLVEIYPATAQLAKNNRVFLGRVVTRAADQGIGQFLDPGAGLPTQENTHEIARKVIPAARVCYVDIDPMAVLHAKSLLAGSEGIAAVQADLADYDAVLADEQVWSVIDLAEPVCVIMASVLHFYLADEARRIARAYIDRIASGSAVAISCVHQDDPVAWAEAVAGYQAAAVHNHSTEEMLSFFSGLEVVPPGLAPAGAWHGGRTTAPDAASTGSAYQLAGVGVKP